MSDREEVKPSDVLQSIADVLLGAPEVWTAVGWYAVDDNNKTIATSSPRAAQWCAIGLIRVAKISVEDPCRKYLKRAIRTPHIASWNDTQGRTVTEVQSAFQKAADLARREGQ